jgi:hypothetical protein
MEAYFPLPAGADLMKLFRGRPAKADEVSTHLKPGDPALDGNWIKYRMRKDTWRTQEALDAGQ